MSAKKSKKFRQMFGRAVRDEAVKTVASWNDAIRPKPRWCPMFIYRAALKLVLK